MIFGHQQIQKILRNQIESDRLSHAYLFWGVEGIGKKLVALEFVKSLLCLNSRDGGFCGECDSCRLMRVGNHPDFRLIEPEEEQGDKFSRLKEIGIALIRQVIGLNNLRPILASRKVIVVNDAQYLTDQAQNAFLKSLEEPQKSTVFILIIENQGDLLETVISRCRKVKFLTLDFEDFKKVIETAGISAAELKELYLLCSGRPGLALNFSTAEGREELERGKKEFLTMFKKGFWERYCTAEILAKDEKKIFAAVNLWRVLTRDLILAKVGQNNQLINQSLEPIIAKEAQNHQLDKLLRIFKLLNFLVSSLKNTNFNPRLALDLIMTEI